jgi:hypothetical protein
LVTAWMNWRVLLRLRLPYFDAMRFLMRTSSL